MVIVAALIFVVVALAVIAAVVRGGDAVTLDLEWVTVDTDARVIFFSGVVTLLLFLLGVWMLTKGFSRSRQRRSEVKQLRKRAEASEKAARKDRESTGSGPESSRTESSRRHDGPDEYFDSSPREK